MSYQFLISNIKNGLHYRMKISLLTIKILTLLLAAFLLPAGGAFAAQLVTTVTDDPNAIHRYQASTTASELSDQYSDTYDFTSVHVAYGSCSVFATTSIPPVMGGVLSDDPGAIGSWDDDVTVNTDTGDTMVIVRFTMHLHGAMSGIPTPNFLDIWQVSVSGAPLYTGTLDPTGYGNTPIGDLETFTYGMYAQPGETFPLSIQLNCQAAASGDGSADPPWSGNATCDMQLTGGAIAVYNTATNPINFTAEMHMRSE